jgi:hypothetical protein
MHDLSFMQSHSQCPWKVTGASDHRWIGRKYVNPNRETAEPTQDRHGDLMAATLDLVENDDQVDVGVGSVVTPGH